MDCRRAWKGVSDFMGPGSGTSQHCIQMNETSEGRTGHTDVGKVTLIFFPAMLIEGGNIIRD